MATRIDVVRTWAIAMVTLRRSFLREAFNVSTNPAMSNVGLG